MPCLERLDDGDGQRRGESVLMAAGPEDPAMPVSPVQFAEEPEHGRLVEGFGHLVLGSSGGGGDPTTVYRRFIPVIASCRTVAIEPRSGTAPGPRRPSGRASRRRGSS